MFRYPFNPRTQTTTAKEGFFSTRGKLFQGNPYFNIWPLNQILRPQVSWPIKGLLILRTKTPLPKTASWKPETIGGGSWLILWRWELSLPSFPPTPKIGSTAKPPSVHMFHDVLDVASVLNVWGNGCLLTLHIFLCQVLGTYFWGSENNITWFSEIDVALEIRCCNVKSKIKTIIYIEHCIGFATSNFRQDQDKHLDQCVCCLSIYQSRISKLSLHMLLFEFRFFKVYFVTMFRLRTLSSTSVFRHTRII